MKPESIKKRHFILTGIVLTIFLILFAAPRIAKWYIVKHSPELIGRSIAIDKIRVNYFTGTIRIKDLKLYEADGNAIFASFRQLKVNIDYLPLFRNEYVVQYISLDDPYIQVLQDGSRFNFSDLMTSDSTSQEKDTLPGEPAKYIINNIRIARGFIKYTDIPLDHTISLDSLDLLIPGFTWNSDSTNLDVEFRFVDGGGLQSDLSLNQADSTYSVNLVIDSLNLDIIEPYVRKSIKITSLGGFLSSDLLIKGSISSVLRFFVSGINHIYGFQLQDTLNRTILAFNDLTVAVDTFELDRNRIRIDSISLKDPFVLFELIDTTNNWLALLKTMPEDQVDTLTQTADTLDSETGFSYNYPRIIISGGNLLFSDKTLDYPFEYKIDSFQLSVGETMEIPGNITFDFMAGLNGTGMFHAEGILDPDDPDNNMDVSLEIGQFRMKDVDAYFRHFLGFPVTGGIMNFNTNNKLRTKSLDSDNSIYFRRFTLAPKLDTEPRYKVPLRLAIGILSDKDGIIDLKAPVKMKGDEVKIINLGKIIFRIIGNLFVKAAVAPFNLLSGLYDVDPESLQEISLGLVKTPPDEKNMKSIEIISDILYKKPQLNVDLIYCINKSKATDSLAYMLTLTDFIKTSEPGGQDQADIADTTLIMYLKGKPFFSTMTDSLSLDKLCRVYIGEDTLTGKLDSLRVFQTGFIRNYLTAEREIVPERIRIIEITPDSIMPDFRYPSFRIYFNAD